MRTRTGARGFVGVLAVAGLAVGCANAPPPGADATASQVVDDPGSFVGKRLTVAGEVERVRGERMFTLDAGFGNGELLVLGMKAPAAGADMKVDGTVRTMVVADVEREVGWDLDPQIEVEFAQRPVLIASGVGTAQAGAAAAPAGGPRVEDETLGAAAAKNEPDAKQAAAPAGAEVRTEGVSPSAPVERVATIVGADDPAAMVGRSVHLSDVRVARVIGDRGFWLDSERELFARLAPRLDAGEAEWSVCTSS